MKSDSIGTNNITYKSVIKSIFKGSEEYIIKGINNKLLNLDKIIEDEILFSSLANDENSISFVIERPIWESKGILSLFIIIILSFIFVSMNKIKKLEYLLNESAKELKKEKEISKIYLHKAIENKRNRNNYFTNLSHELRTPLNVINSIEQLITNINSSENGIEKEKLNQYMEISRKNTTRLLNLINNLIDTTKAENGEYKLNKEKHNIVHIVEEVSLSLKDSIEDKGISLIIDTDIEEKTINCDKQEIERCIINLLSNALKFTKEGGVIKVNIKDLNKKIMIIVEDNGIGIDKIYHKSIFDRFNQIIDENSELKGGSGLGLTITKQIIDLHKGNIYFESEINKGSKFTIILPSN